MLLTQAAFDLLTSVDHPPMTSFNPANYPAAIVFNQSDCKTQLYYVSEGLAIIILLPIEGGHEGSIHVCFNKEVFSNFVAIHGADVTINDMPVSKFYCGEQYFKAGCVAFHISRDAKLASAAPASAELVAGAAPAELASAAPADAEERALNRLSVLAAVMGASEPKVAKFATGKLSPFYAAEWDEVSFGIMTQVQLWKATDPANHAFHMYISWLRRAHGIPCLNTYFYEAAGLRDLVWGCGLLVEDMADSIRARPSLDWGTQDPSAIPEAERPFPGQSKLGTTIKIAHHFVTGYKDICAHETVEDLIARSGTDTPVFTFHDPNKRARTGSDE
jgi:hypothetical protein